MNIPSTRSRENAEEKIPAVFLDRDGVINALIYHQDASVIDSPFTPGQFRVLAHVPEAIRSLNNLGLPVIVVSNQPGIAKRHFDLQTLQECDKKLHRALRRVGAHVDGIYYCLHHPDSRMKSLRRRCECRKPAIGLLKKAAREFGVSLSDSYMVGDGLTDIEAGNRAGCRTVFIGKWKCEHCQYIRPLGLRPSFVAKDLWTAVQWISVDRGFGVSLPDQIPPKCAMHDAALDLSR